MRILAAVLLLASSAAAQTLTSGVNTLSFPKTGNSYGIRITGANGAAAESPQPIQLFLCASCNETETQKPAQPAAYTALTVDNPSQISASASVTTPGGSVFKVLDTFTRNNSGIELRRDITVISAGNEHGFASQFLIGFATPRPIEQYHFLAPAVWYDDNSHAAPSSFATDYRNHFFYFRETRLPLPFVMMNDPGGATLTLAHIHSTPHSTADEASGQWLTDPGIQYGSLGVQRTPNVQLGFIYPANEGEGSHVAGHRDWNHRSHPVRKDLHDTYTLLITLSSEPSYTTAVHDTWRTLYALFNPSVASMPMDTIYSDQIALLNHYSLNKNGAQFFPFNVELPSGDVHHNGPVNIGFTGQDTALGFNLLRYGVLHNDKQSLANGKATLDFWADKSMRPSGLPYTGFQPDQNKWVDSDCHPTFLRALTDGLEGMLNAAIFMREHNQPQRNWETWSNTTGEFLLKHQMPDGSFNRAYNPDGSAYVNTNKEGCNAKGFGESKYNTTNALRSLVLLYVATGDKRYLNAAISAGNYSLDAIYRNAIFVGGTADNPNTLDKEGAVLAMRGALALYDITHDQKWLAAARTAADFTETWSYSWSWPIRNAPPQYASAGTRGNSLIATGHSGADISLSFDSYTFFRLYLLSDRKDEHYLRFAQDIERNTKLTTQVSGVPAQQFGFGVSGLAGEAVSLAEMQWNNGNASTLWLPWVSDAEIDPLQRMQDSFGVTSIEAAQKLPDLDQRNARIYPKPGTIGWSK